ncbi:hypothetical protein ACJMK2_019816 [Sinanodonta woodiana]|uniref:Expansin-like EG45 domain-containing protein n=1 Tax=Sinanodonta woodiana TaxID=1069815 RepID=A0ABD3TY59_SINWO
MILTGFLSICIFTFAGCKAEQKCTGNPRMYNGKMCASTTWYIDGRKGACGCGPANGDSQFEWNHSGFVAAASQNMFDYNPSKSWCGQMCGKCIKITSTGGFVPGQGGSVAAGQSHVFMVTNLCPNEYPNLSWCSQDRSNGYLNKYGYHAHFDLEDGAGQIRSIGWQHRNPEVTYEEVNCDQAHHQNSRTPSNGMYRQCQCGQRGNCKKKLTGK